MRRHLSGRAVDGIKNILLNLIAADAVLQNLQNFAQRLLAGIVGKVARGNRVVQTVGKGVLSLNDALVSGVVQGVILRVLQRRNRVLISRAANRQSLVLQFGVQRGHIFRKLFVQSARRLIIYGVFHPLARGVGAVHAVNVVGQLRRQFVSVVGNVLIGIVHRRGVQTFQIVGKIIGRPHRLRSGSYASAAAAGSPAKTVRHIISPFLSKIYIHFLTCREHKRPGRFPGIDAFCLHIGNRRLPPA